MLSEICQRKANTIQFHSYVAFKKTNEEVKKKEPNQETDHFFNVYFLVFFFTFTFIFFNLHPN